MSGRQRYQWGLFLIVAVALVWWALTDGGPQAQPESQPASTSQTPTHRFTVTTTPTTDPTVAGSAGGTDSRSGLPIVQVSDLPAEAVEILRRIERGGPFDEDEDGESFQNREGILPDERGGYYREYTVPTPGSDDRGARRIVAGESGERYWTGDHYRSFSRIAL